MVDRILPQSNEDSQPFWDAVKARRLDIQTCADCGKLRHYPRPVCSDCYSMNVAWTTVSGRGTVHSWTVCHQAFHPAFADDVPFTMVTVDLEEGVRIAGRLDGIDDATMEIGMPVEVDFEEVGDNVTLPIFRRRGEI